MRDFFTRMGIVSELLQFLWMRKHYWLIPMILLLGVIVGLILLSHATGAAPLMYTLF
jgi:hypothetical protein